MLHQTGFVVDQRARRAGELAELVHAVVDNAAVLEIAKAPAGIHRAVVPEDGLVEVAVLIHHLDGFLRPIHAASDRQLRRSSPRMPGSADRRR